MLNGVGCQLFYESYFLTVWSVL